MAKRSEKKPGSVRPDVIGLLQALVIIAAGAWIYWPVLHGDWLWDDAFDTQNPVTRSAKGLWSIWFEPGSQVDYYPVKASVQWVQWHLWGRDTFGYHVTNVVLHVVSALLVWRLFGKLGLRLAWLGGLIFAVHPSAVESVAWIAELKNTLSMPPFLLAACFYLDYDQHGRRRDYLLALGFFLVAMLCKPTMVMFPVVILLYIWWKRQRIGWNDIKASAPFFIISLGLGLVTILIGTWYQQRHPQFQDVVPMGGDFSRLACAGLSISFYFWNCIWPVGLLPIYPRWKVDPPSLLQFIPCLILGGMIGWFWVRRQSWGLDALLGFGFFLVILAPFLGLNSVFYMSFTWVMDHFLYIPILGLIGVAVAALDLLYQRLPTSFRSYGIGIVAAVLALLAWESHAYAGKFINQETLWTYELKHNPDAWPAHNNLGNILLDQGRISDAVQEYKETLRINPGHAPAHVNWGFALAQAGQFPEAIRHYQEAARLNSNSSVLQNNWGNAMVQSGHPAEAIAHYQEALRIDPNFAQAQNNMGNVFFLTGNYAEAIVHYQEALRIDPAYPEAQNNWGIALAQEGHPAEAIIHYQEALRLKPDYAQGRANWGSALLQLGRNPEAIEQFQEALRLDPNNSDARNNLARVEAQGASPHGK